MNIFNILIRDEFNGIGKNSCIPWHFPHDMNFFYKKTIHHVVIMGRKTFESLQCKPLNNRINIIVSTSMFQENETRTSKIIDDKNQNNCNEHNKKNNEKKTLFYTCSLINALKIVEQYFKENNIFIIGGTQLYLEASLLKQFKGSYITTIYTIDKIDIYQCDTKINFEKITHSCIPNHIEEYQHNQFIKLSFDFYEKYPENLESCDYQYFQLVNEIIAQNTEENTKLENEEINTTTRIGRNGSVLSLFSYQMKFDLTKSFPILTSKKMYWKGIVEELLFFLHGKTNVDFLRNQGIHIWDKNTTRDFLDQHQLHHYQEYDMGPMYGYNWRYIGAEYKGCMKSYKNQGGIDQLANVIDLILNDPTSRRIVMTAFNPITAKEGCLYPCHSCFTQFYVSNNYLDMNTYQRSADVYLGLPFNISQQALLLCIIAKVTNKIPRKLTIQLGDCHIYKEHLMYLQEQANYRFYQEPNCPWIVGDTHSVNITTTSALQAIDSLTREQIHLHDYVFAKKLGGVMIA